MRLDELVGVKSKHELSLYQLIDAWEKESGYKKLGQGNFAYAYKHPSRDEVLKLWIKDSGYEKFVEYCRAHQSNKSLPKILSPVKSFSTFHRRLHGFPDKIKYVRMELLRKLTPDDMGPGFDRKLMGVLNKIKQGIMKNDKLPKETLDKIALHWNDDKIPQHVLDLIDAIAELKHLGRLDTHDDNIMVRPSTGEFVITDPIADDEDIEAMHEIFYDPPQVDDVDQKYAISGKSKKTK